VTTPSGGAHWWYIVPADREIPGNSAGRLGPGLDRRGKHGYVVAPPSVIDGRRYRWNWPGDIVGLAPDELLDLLEEPQDAPPGRTPEQWLSLVTSGVEQGARNDSVTRLAGLLFRYLPAQHAEITATLIAAWNEVAVRPPLSQDELWRTLDSVAARELRRRGLEHERAPSRYRRPSPARGASHPYRLARPLG
jgi:hypothetical protein